MADDTKVVTKPQSKEKKPEVTKGATLGDLLAAKGQTIKTTK